MNLIAAIVISAGMCSAELEPSLLWRIDSVSSDIYAVVQVQSNYDKRDWLLAKNVYQSQDLPIDFGTPAAFRICVERGEGEIRKLTEMELRNRQERFYQDIETRIAELRIEAENPEPDGFWLFTSGETLALIAKQARREIQRLEEHKLRMLQQFEKAFAELSE